MILASTCQREPNPAQVRRYNNRLVDIQNRAIAIDKEFEKIYYSNFYYLGYPENPEYKAFVNEYNKKYLELLFELDTIQNPVPENLMKKRLTDILFFMKNGIHDYYTKLLTIHPDSTAKAQRIVARYNRQYKEYEAKFKIAQKRLARQHKFNLVE